MHHPKHLYAAGILTGILCGLMSALTAYSTVHTIATQDLATSNPVIGVILISMVVGALIGLVVSLLIHQISKS